ncbi:M13 family metallopeptidase [Pseudoduganella sp. GCM10020061]|uniref:M13 family metallopeptidase n=1 Tax=Pseudoduganella sp. GCM10020061 TaxID=3317345 RepID=UPI00362DD385
MQAPIKTALCAALCGAFLSLPLQAAGQAAVQAPAPAPEQATRYPMPAPGDDFYAFANHEWLQHTEIPADKSAWGAGGQLAEETNNRIRQMIEGLVADKNAKGEARKVADFYATFMDEAAIEAKGLEPIKPVLAKIDAIRDRKGLTQALGQSLRADVDPLNATNFYTENLFGIWIAQGLTEPTRYTPYILQGGLGMPDRAYYVDTSERMAGLRAKYQEHIAAMLTLAGYDNAAARAARVMELERKLAESHATREDSANIQKSNNPWTLKDFAAKAPGMDWNALFKAARLSGQKKFIVWHPGAMTGAARLVGSEDLSTWKDWLAFHQLNHFASTLPKAMSDQKFEFTGRALRGTPQQSVRWKRGLSATNAALDEAVGHLYVDRYFPAENKARIQQMVKNIVAAFDKRVDKLDWMAPATRAEAKAKLKTLYVGVGYPDKWKSYAGLTVKPGDALGNAMRAEEFHYAQELSKLGRKVDPKEWAMPPHLVNAINMPMQNALNFPAAILQPPFFDPKASDAHNYGAIGAVIGHEISHSFDDMGAQFDSRGRLRDWWTKDDAEHFKSASQALVKQYDAYKAFDDLALNGQLTLSENLADLAGLAASHDAFRATLPSGASVEDADREFFRGFAQTWRTKTREQALRAQIVTDGHAPGPWRTYTVRNLDAWYKAFDVKPGQKLYLAPEQRVRVW